jgi:predicted Zn finger-like uncharacterized protein
MLFTRCPECDTTFRVNDETLKKAGGQVRCGRCASVFNAYAELHDPTAKSFEAEPAAHGNVETPPAPPTAPPPAPPAAPVKPLTQPAASATRAEPTGAAPVAAAAAQASVAADDAAASSKDVPDAQAISATEVDRVLANDVGPPVPQLVYAWLRAGDGPAKSTRSRWWAAGAALALLVLGIQSIHHFRSDIAGNAVFGPVITAIYGAAGGEITPSWDVAQYEIIDWVATAEPNSRGLGS